MTLFLPRLPAEDYEAFRSLPTVGLPDTFEKWCRRIDKQIAEVKALGDDASLVDVNFQEFAAFLRLHRMAAQDSSLEHCAAEKAANQRQ